MTWKKAAGKPVQIVLGFAALIGGFLLSYSGLVTAPRLRLVVEESRQARMYAPQRSTGDSSELLLVYVGSSTCGPANDEELPLILDRIKMALEKRAGAHGLDFAAIGIAQDWDIRAGVRHLDRAGPFDEIQTGRSWANTGLRRYLWNEIPGEASTPQVIVVFMDRTAPDGSLRAAAAVDERLLMRKVGLEEIQSWQKLGCPLPPFPFDSAPITDTAQTSQSLYHEGGK